MENEKRISHRYPATKEFDKKEGDIAEHRSEKEPRKVPVPHNTLYEPVAWFFAITEKKIPKIPEIAAKIGIFD